MPLDRICIAGATGMIGSHLVEALGERAEPLPREMLAAADARLLAGFLRERGVGLLVNAVGAAGGGRDALRAVNVELAGRLAEGCALAEAACVYLGSARVFDASRPGARGESEAPDLPGGPGADDYGRSKLLGEESARAALAGGRHYVLRMPMVLGRRAGRPDGQIATRLLERARQGLETRAAKDVVTQAVHVSDVVAAVQVLARGEAPAGVYHLTSVDHASLHAIVSRLFAGCGLPSPGEALASEFDSAATGPQSRLLAPGRLARWMELPSWEGAVDRFVADLRRMES